MSDAQEQSVLASSTNFSTPPKLVLILGGARSGKSTFAERLAASSGRNVAFIATATASDEDMRQRIARHRASRPQDWHTLEEPLDLVAAVKHASNLADVMLLDCMTLWLANWLGQRGDINLEQDASLSDAYTNGVLKDIEELIATIAALAPNKTLIVVSNEVGSGIVPAYPLGRVYRDTLGRVNQRLAWAADRVYLMVAGLGIDIKRLHVEASL